VSHHDPRIVRRLRALRGRYGAGVETRKVALLRDLERRALSRPKDVVELHETLCAWRAYPDGPELLATVERLLSRFARRRDLLRFRAALASSGIAGTATRFSFFAPTARWLAGRFPRLLEIDGRALEDADRLERLLPLLALYAETPGLDELDFGLGEWLRRLRGPRETDASFLVRRLAALPASPFVREVLYDGLDVPLVLRPGPGTPSRTRDRHPVRSVAWQRAPLDRRRPKLPQDLARRPRSVRALRPAEAAPLVDLARAAMVSRQRDLDVFSYASLQDVRLVDFEDGLQFACMGAIPERRLLLEAVYGFLTLKNGVPIGYVLSSALFGSVEIAYNVFDTFRGGEAGRVYGRVLAMARHLFHADSFTIFPYQLGEGNDEALRSGAWWFYRKVGFLPKDRGALRILRREQSRMERDPAHRSSMATLRSLAGKNLYYHLGKEREDVIGVVELPNVGLKVTTWIARNFGSDREEASRACERDAARLLGVRSLSGFSPGERLAWQRWAPLVRILPGLARWSPDARRDLVAVIRAKGGRRESDFVARFDRHRPLRRSILRLASETPLGEDV
jgi:hypothetical protein